MPRSGLVSAGQAVLDALTVVLDVLEHASAQGFATGNDGRPTTGGAHLLGGEVGVGSGPVPVTLDWLGVKGDVHAEVFGDAFEQPPRDPELVGDFDGVENSDLELPLAHHHFGVSAFDADSGAQAGQGVSFDDVTAGHLVATDTAVVGTLGCGVTNFGPTVGTAVLEEGVLLLDTEHGLEARVLLVRRDGEVTGVGGVWGHVGVEHFAHHENVVGTTQWVRAGPHGNEHAVRERTSGLVGAGTVEAPDRRLLAVSDDARLRTQLARRFGSVNPDVLSLVGHGHSLFVRCCDCQPSYFAVWTRTRAPTLVNGA